MPSYGYSSNEINKLLTLLENAIQNNPELFAPVATTLEEPIEDVDEEE